jgi:hypothetical protein
MSERKLKEGQAKRSKVRPMRVIGKPEQRREFVFRGVTFFTRNLGALDQFSNQYCWFAVGSWTHDEADGVFSDLVAAIADRFNIWEHLGLSFAPKFRSQQQLQALSELENEIRIAGGDV